MHTFNVFDFLKDTVSKVPEFGGSDAVGEDRSVAKRRSVNVNFNLLVRGQENQALS